MFFHKHAIHTYQGTSLKRLLCRKMSPDVIIIGSGVIGSSIALELSKKGFKTLNLDSLHGSGLGSTSFSSGICRSWYSVKDSIMIAEEGFEYYKNWGDHIGVDDPKGNAKLRECGGLILNSEESLPFINKFTKLFDELKIPYEVWDNNEIQNRLHWSVDCYGPPKRIDHPHFGEPNGSKLNGGIYCPKSGYVSDPQLATHNLQIAAEKKGGLFLFKKKIIKIRQKNSKVQGVELSDGTYIASPIVVNAAGPYSSIITQLAFPRDSDIKNDMVITTKAMRQEVCTLNSPTDLNYDQIGVIASDFDVGCYWRPEVGNKILIGTQEPTCDSHRHVFLKNPDECDYSFTDQWTNQVYRVCQRIPSLQIGSTQGVVAMYDVTEDWVPIYDKSPLGGYYMAIGTSGNQFKNAAPAGALMAHLIESCENGHDHDNIPVKYPLRLNKGFVINLGKFSRLRSPLGTTNSVVG